MGQNGSEVAGYANPADMLMKILNVFSSSKAMLKLIILVQKRLLHLYIR